MTFRTYDRLRRLFLRFGLAVAALVFPWHLCPKSDENPMNPPPDHVEEIAFVHLDMPTTLAGSTIADPGRPFVPMDSEANNVVIRMANERQRRVASNAASSNMSSNAALWSFEAPQPTTTST